MKRTITLAVLLLTATLTYGQNFLGQTIDYVKDYQREDGTELVETENNPGSIILEYVTKTGNRLLYAFDKEDSTCLAYVLITPKKGLSWLVSDLNKRHNRIDSKTWVDEDNIIKITLDTKNDTGWIAVTYEYL